MNLEERRISGIEGDVHDRRILILNIYIYILDGGDDFRWNYKKNSPIFCILCLFDANRMVCAPRAAARGETGASFSGFGAIAFLANMLSMVLAVASGKGTECSALQISNRIINALT